MEFWKIVLYFAVGTFGATNIFAVVDINPEYYWRDYDGTIPPDAVPGGRDKSGSTTYIGQTIHTNTELMTGEIVPSEKKIFYYIADRGYSTTENVKILCSAHLEQFEWIKTDLIGLRYLVVNKHLVLGGNASNVPYPLLVGRASLGDQLIVGKVTVMFGQNEGIAYHTVGEKHYQKDSSYEVLSYNPKCSNVNIHVYN